MSNSLLWWAGALVLLALMAPLTAWAAPGDVTEAGKDFVELLAKEDFAQAVEKFDATMKTAMPDATLREAWQTLQEHAGPFRRQLGATTNKVGTYDVVLVTCQFERMTLDTKVVFDAKGQVTGLFFAPTASTPPPYARPDAFREREITVGKGEWQLPGTLSLPSAGAGPWPGVVLVHGSGPNDRDETVGGNKPFRDLAWGLAARGIAVLRYEKRTKQHALKFKEKGLGLLTVKEEIIDDALTAVAQLRATDGVDPKRVFVLGHSLGGMVAPRIGQADANIAGLIIMAGCASRPPEDLMVEQVRYLLSFKEKPTPEEKAALADLESTAAKIKKLTAADASSPALLAGVPAAYWLDLRKHDTLAIAKTLKQPMLILQGGRDYQAAPADFHHWSKELKDRSRVTFKLYPRLNHLFIAGEGMSTPEEYLRPGHVEEAVVKDIAEWISKCGEPHAREVDTSSRKGS
jgi:dienelactone hydrolase